jgi:TRAP-type C4-dicarboxylate transport system permease small subunit
MVMATMGVPEFMSALGAGAIIVFAIGVIAWLGYCISSIARAADALERIANALEDDVDDEEEEER